MVFRFSFHTDQLTSITSLGVVEKIDPREEHNYCNTGVYDTRLLRQSISVGTRGLVEPTQTSRNTHLFFLTLVYRFRNITFISSIRLKNTNSGRTRMDNQRTTILDSLHSFRSNGVEDTNDSSKIHSWGPDPLSSQTREPPVTLDSIQRSLTHWTTE